MPPQVEITHRQEFSSAHRLTSPELSEEANRRLYGPCYEDHGHNYEVEVTVRGEVAPATGMVMNLNDLMVLVDRVVVQRVDHRHLNRDVPFLRGAIPTAEVLAIAFWRELEPELTAHPGCRLHRVRVRESRRNVADYYGPEPA